MWPHLWPPMIYRYMYVICTGRVSEVTWLSLCFKLRQFCFTFISDFVEWRSTMLWVLESRQSQRLCSVLWQFGNSQWEWEPATKCYNWRSTGPELWSCLRFSCLHHGGGLSDEQYTGHMIQVLVDTTTNARHHRPFTARPKIPAICVVAVIYYAIPTTRLLLCTGCLPLATYFGDILGFILCYGTFSLFTC